MKATIKDVAKAANVSTATVSRVLSKKAGTYREDTGKRVREVAHQLGYHRNLSAAELASNAVKTIAIIINNTRTNFWQEVVDGIQESINSHHLNSVIFYAGNNDSKMLTQAINAALERSVSGILLVAAKTNVKQLALLDQSGLPYRFVSFYGNDHQQSKFISSNNIKIGKMATQYLIDHGHKKIALIGIDKSSTGNQRLLGYEKAMTKANLVVEPGWVQYGDYSMECGQKLFNQINQLNVTAVIAGSDMVAIGVLKAAKRLHIKVPDHLSIMSIDGTFLCDVTTPSITSVTQDFRKMGVVSVNNLINKDPSTFIPIKIVERESIKDLSS